MGEHDLEQWAAQFSETILKPLRDVGTLLAREIEKTNREMAELRSDVKALGSEIDRLDDLIEKWAR